MPRASLLALLLVPALAAAQTNEREQAREERLEPGLQAPNAPKTKPLTKAEERARFHPGRVVGTSAAERSASYQKRLRMEADSAYGGLAWRNLGPEVQSGRVVAIVSPKDEPGTVLVAFATGGLYRTTDDGATWTSLWNAMPAFGIGDVAVSPDGKTILVGTGEANSQRTSYAGTGVYRSEDAGRTWSFAGLPESHHIGKVVMDPRDPKRAWVCAMGHLYSQNPERGVYRTNDGGRTWTKCLDGDEFTGAIDLALNPKSPDVAVAALWDRDRRAWNFRESGRGSSVRRTEDGGRTWRPVAGLPSGDDLGRVGLATTPANPRLVLAYVDDQGEDRGWADEDDRAPSGKLTPRRFARLDEATLLALPRPALEAFWKDAAPEGAGLDDALAEVKAGKATVRDLMTRIEGRRPGLFEPGLTLDELYRSDDGGKTFRRIARFGPHGGYYWGKVFINPADANDIWVGGVEMLRSRDGGRTWATVEGGLHSDHHAVLWTGAPGKTRIWEGNDGGPYLSPNDGKTWRRLNNLSVGQTTTLALDPRNATLYTGLQDNGTLKGTRRYVPGRSDVDDWKPIFGGDGSWIAVDPREDGGGVYAAAQFGAHGFIEERTGARRSVVPRPIKGGEPLRFNWISPLVLDAFAPGLVYVGSQYLHRSFDGGRKWEAISPDLTRNRPNGDVPYSTLKDVSPSPLRFGLIYAGADDGRVTMTPDGGFQWLDVPTPRPDKWVARVLASRHAVGTVYCAQSGYREDDFAPYLWRSTDFGRTWTSIAGDLPMEPVNVVREDPKDPKILYVGTDMGVFVARDADAKGGPHWETLGNDLGHLPVHDLAIHEGDDEIVAATHARGLFATPLAPLRLVTDEVRKAPLTILDAPETAVPSPLPSRGRDVWDGAQNGSGESVPTLPILLYLSKAAEVDVELIPGAHAWDAAAVVRQHLSLRKGLNRVLLPLTLRPGRTVPADLLAAPRPKPRTAAEALADPFAAYRPVFVKLGEYTIYAAVGTVEVQRPVKIRER